MKEERHKESIREIGMMLRRSDGDLTRNGLSKLLQEEGYDRSDSFRSGNVEILRNPDPILRYFSVRGDESHYRSMERSNDALAAAKEHRVSVLVGPGTKLCVGSAKNETANRNYDFILSALKGIYGWSTFIEKLDDANFWGWRPLEIVWRNDFIWDGVPRWAPKRIKEKDPWKYAITVDGFLAKKPGAGENAYRIVNKGMAKYQWLIATGGSNATPYGEAWYQNAHLIVFAKEKFLQMFVQGMERSMGIIKVTENPMAPQSANVDDSVEGMERIVEEVRGIVDTLAQNNILIQRGRLAVELLSNVSFADGWKTALDYLDKCITLLIIGENLSMYVGAKGSHAAADAQIQGVLKQYVRRDAATCRGVINDQLIRYMLEVNFGPQKPDEMPKVEFEVDQEVNLEAARFLFESGATLDVASIGRKFGVPVVKEGDPEAHGAIHLKKQDPPPVDTGGFGGTPGRGPTPTRPIEERNKDKAKKDRKEVKRAIEDLEPPEGADDALSEFWKTVSKKYLETHGPSS